MNTAPELLKEAARIMDERAKQYDSPSGERSMARTVAVFNSYHDKELTEAQGWHFMQILKDVRLFTNPEKPHKDSIDDGVAYAALKGEAMLVRAAEPFVGHLDDVERQRLEDYVAAKDAKE